MTKEKLKRLDLTAAELSQLLNYLADIKYEGVYSGNKDQFWSRHDRIDRKIREYFDMPAPPAREGGGVNDKY